MPSAKYYTTQNTFIIYFIDSIRLFIKNEQTFMFRK